MANHAEKMAAFKRGPGVFVYDGSAFDTESIAPVFDSRGKVAKPEGLKRTKLATLKMHGVEFAAGKEVAVDDAALALKLRSLGCFKEIEPKAKKAEKAAPEA